jgi:uncharacterized repeat protein (TIGR03803 family)
MTRELSRSFLSHAVRILQLILCSVVLAGCSKGTVGTVPLQPYRSNDVASASTAAQRFVHRAQERLSPHRTAQLLYSFEGGRDGAKPYAGLIALNGLLYGTTTVGGASDDGIVFEVDASGKERVLYSFEGGEDGAYPRAGLLVVDGTLYGTTSEGGDESSNPYGNGTVFEVSPSGTERVLYSFKGGRDGAEPFAGLIAMNGKLYGTTAYGGESQYGGSLGVKGLGTVFEVTTSGKERVLYRFKGGNDSAIPMADLIAVKGVLYGTTLAAVFKVNTSGEEHVLYRFKGGKDGALAMAPLIAVGDKFYSTTYQGGMNNEGTVFVVDASGKHRVLYSFAGGDDGAYPSAGLVDVNGTLYGTTAGGGGSGGGTSGGIVGDGTVYEVSTSGDEGVVYSFEGSYPYGDGANPVAGLVAVKRKLYGTTRDGGANDDGTVFEVLAD